MRAGAPEGWHVTPQEEALLSLERTLRQFPSTYAQRARWRSSTWLIHQKLSSRGHLGLPALVPGLVHARLNTALMVAGYISKRQLGARRFLLLGTYAGLEVRILKDLGATDVLGVERWEEIVRLGVRSQLVAESDILVDDYWSFLSQTTQVWHEVLVLSPQSLSLADLAQATGPRLRPGGHLVVIAQSADVYDIPADTDTGYAMEGLMQWYHLAKPTPPETI